MIFQYKGYEGSVLYSEADKVWHGKIMNIADLVTYENEAKMALEITFRDCVNEYIQLCELFKNNEKINR